ncbi:unnamed protein product [Taenia asiatica]|uniref:Uncharacterized protein n=1 Tax=Taenia asiatica TaxID=60517 RepID=A0A0R3WGB3_TAEAS|nr:unnamed protein product [Taenia asiatica]
MSAYALSSAYVSASATASTSASATNNIPSLLYISFTQPLLPFPMPSDLPSSTLTTTHLLRFSSSSSSSSSSSHISRRLTEEGSTKHALRHLSCPVPFLRERCCLDASKIVCSPNSYKRRWKTHCLEQKQGLPTNSFLPVLSSIGGFNASIFIVALFQIEESRELEEEAEEEEDEDEEEEDVEKRNGIGNGSSGCVNEMYNKEGMLLVAEAEVDAVAEAET